MARTSRANESFDENDYPTAIQYFRDAYRRDCTKYELLNIISRAYELKGDKPEAINALETYLKRAPAGDPSLESIQKRLVEFEGASCGGRLGESVCVGIGQRAAHGNRSASGERRLRRQARRRRRRRPNEAHSLPPYFLIGGGLVALGVGIPLAIVGAGNVSERRQQNSEALGCDADNDVPGKAPTEPRDAETKPPSSRTALVKRAKSKKASGSLSSGSVRRRWSAASCGTSSSPPAKRRRRAPTSAFDPMRVPDTRACPSAAPSSRGSRRSRALASLVVW